GSRRTTERPAAGGPRGHPATRHRRPCPNPGTDPNRRPHDPPRPRRPTDLPRRAATITSPYSDPAGRSAMTRPGTHPVDLAPSLWTLPRTCAGRHRAIRAIATVALAIYTRPGQTVIVASPERAVGRAALGAISRAGCPPPPAPPMGAAGLDRPSTKPGHAALLLPIPSWQPPRPASDTTGSPLLVADAWVGCLRQTLLGCRWLLR